MCPRPKPKRKQYGEESLYLRPEEKKHTSNQNVKKLLSGSWLEAKQDLFKK